MPEQINNPRLSAPLAEKYGIKGKLSLQLDSVVVPVTSDEVGYEPFTDILPVSVSRVEAPAGVGVDSFVLVQPGPNTILVITSIMVNNADSADHTYQFRRLSAANVAALTITDDTQMQLWKTAPRSSSPGRQAASSGQRATNAGKLGGVLATVFLSVQQGSFVFNLGPGGYALYSDDRAAAAAISVTPSGADLEANASFMGLEYRLRG